jgi:murein DD-endopeptidase MepM/ murein hydrolase activator NlpD
MLTLVGGPAGMAVALAVLAAPAGAASPPHAQGGGTLAGPPQAGGSQYGAPVKRARPARPIARYFRVGPRTVVAPKLPTIALRVDEYGATTVNARVVLLPMTETGSIVRFDLGKLHVGRRVVASFPAGTTLAPGRYRVRLHVRGLRGTVLARKASTPGLTTLTVRAPEPETAPLPDAAGHVFPVAGPHTYGEAFGAPRKGYSHQGQDIPAAEGVPVVAPVAGAITFSDYQAKAAGYYIVEKGSDGYDYFFAHCQKGSVVVAAGQAVLAGQQLCNVGATGDASGPHLHFEAWEGGWRVDGSSHPIDPLPLLKSWDVSATPAAARR